MSDKINRARSGPLAITRQEKLGHGIRTRKFNDPTESAKLRRNNLKASRKSPECTADFLAAPGRISENQAREHQERGEARGELNKHTDLKTH